MLGEAFGRSRWAQTVAHDVHHPTFGRETLRIGRSPDIGLWKIREVVSLLSSFRVIDAGQV